jgi:hypothetical protein
MDKETTAQSTNDEFDIDLIEGIRKDPKFCLNIQKQLNYFLADPYQCLFSLIQANYGSYRLT